MVVAPWAKARPLVVFRHDERLTDGAVEAEIMARSFGVHWRANRRAAAAVPRRTSGRDWSPWAGPDHAGQRWRRHGQPGSRWKPPTVAPEQFPAFPDEADGSR
jgi:hypothetical protein